MMDFWFILGASAIEPKLLDCVGTPKFERIGWVCLEQSQTGLGMVLKKAAGYLDTPSLLQLRKDLRKGYGKMFTGIPPISVYAAGKICQLYGTSWNSFLRIIRNIHDKYTDAIKATGLKNPSSKFACLLGACIIDQNLCALLPQASGKDYAMEFGYDLDHLSAQDSDEWKTILKFVLPATGVAALQTAMLALDTWDTGCGQTVFPYDDPGTGGSKRAAN